MGPWDQAVGGRDQIVLFAPTLQDAICDDHSVRLFDQVIGRLDFFFWEQHYERVDGRPPIHPRVMAPVILYGLSLGIRSNRKLEDACVNRNQKRGHYQLWRRAIASSVTINNQ